MWGRDNRCQEPVSKVSEKMYKVTRTTTKENAMNKDDMLTALAIAAQMLRGKGKKKEVAADLERLIKELQKGE